MKIGILATSALKEDLAARYGDLPSMFAELLTPQDASLAFETFNVFQGDMPPKPDACDAWLVTGAPESAYDRLPWMLVLEDFIRATLAADIPMVGICFGHQIMAQALGGTVAKEANGKWGMAVNGYSLYLEGEERPDWMDGQASQFALQASHQDQVIELPEGAKRIAGNDFCPNGMLLYGKSGLSMQLHPELPADFISFLIENRRGDSMNDEDADKAAKQVADPVDDQLVARWIVNFMKTAKA